MTTRLVKCPTCYGESVVLGGIRFDEVRGLSYEAWYPCANPDCDDGWVDAPPDRTVPLIPLATAAAVVVIAVLIAFLLSARPVSGALAPSPASMDGGLVGTPLSGAPQDVSALGRPPAPGGAPLPAGGQVGSSIAVGKASWCAPTPKYCHGWGGRSLLAAVPGYDHVPYWAKVCRQDQPKRCVVVHVVSVCACGTGKVIDLTVYAFRDRLGQPLSRGTLDVTVEGASSPRLPATDTAR